VVLIFGINPTAAVVASQVVLSFDIPLALVLLVLLTRRGGLWGSESTGGSPTITASAAARPKPVPPPRSGDQCEAARLKGPTADCRAEAAPGTPASRRGTLEQALARGDEVARRMRAETMLRALPGIGAATARRLMATAGIDGGRRVGGLTAGQRERLLAAVAAVGAELAARHGHRVTIPAGCPSP
jgi:hypothetical protein